MRHVLHSADNPSPTPPCPQDSSNSNKIILRFAAEDPSSVAVSARPELSHYAINGILRPHLQPRAAHRRLQLSKAPLSHSLPPRHNPIFPLLRSHPPKSRSRFPFLSGAFRPISLVRASASATPTPTAPSSPSWQSAALKPLAASIATGVLLWLIPAPTDVSRNAWQLLAIFVATIVGIITQSLPLSAITLMGLDASILTKTLPFSTTFSAFGDPIP